jgi:hypothetical protein
LRSSGKLLCERAIARFAKAEAFDVVETFVEIESAKGETQNPAP